MLNIANNNILETAKQYEIIVLLIILILFEFFLPLYILYILSNYTYKIYKLAVVFLKRIAEKIFYIKYPALNRIGYEELDYKESIKKELNIIYFISLAVVIVVTFYLIKETDIQLSIKISHLVKLFGFIIFLYFILEAIYSYKFNIRLIRNIKITKGELEVYILISYFYKLLLYFIIIAGLTLMVRIFYLAIKIIIPINLHIYTLLFEKSDEYSNWSFLFNTLPQLKITFSEIIFPKLIRFFVIGYVILVLIMSLSYFHFIGWRSSIIWIIGLSVSTLLGKLIIQLLNKLFGDSDPLLISLFIVLTIFTLTHLLKLVFNIIEKK